MTRTPDPRKARAAIRRALADYMSSEGCDCCSNPEKHRAHAATLAKLLRVPKYKYGSGFNFARFQTKTPKK